MLITKIKRSMSKEDQILNELKEYFNNTPSEKINSDWEKTKHLDDIGPTVEEFLKFKKMELLNTDIIMLNSFPAGGKSTLAKMYEEKGYKVLSRDTEGGTVESLVTKFEKLLDLGHKVVLDSTNGSIAFRKAFIDSVKKHNTHQDSTNKKTIGCHIITGEKKKFTNPFSGKSLNVSARDVMKEEALINSLRRMLKINNELYMTANDLPKNVSSDKQSFVLPAIFKHAKSDPIKKEEGFDEILESTFLRTESFEPKPHKAVFIDLDGTVRKTKSGDKYPLKKEDVEILPNSIEVLKKYKADGYMILAITNQSGVERGHLSFEDVTEIIKHTNQLLGGLIDDWYACPHFPSKTTCYCRKPQSGVGIYFERKYSLNLRNCIMVGDMISDFNFARRLDIQFFTEKEFFNR